MYFDDLLDTNYLPLCYQETAATMGYLASLVDDLGSDAVSRADFLEWFRIMSGTNHTSGRSCEENFRFLVVLSVLDDYFYSVNTHNKTTTKTIHNIKHHNSIITSWVHNSNQRRYIFAGVGLVTGSANWIWLSV